MSENKQKLINSSLLIAFSVASVMLGRTLTNTLLLNSYPTSILPYFYLSQAVLLILTTWATAHYQTKNPLGFSFIFKWVAILALLLFAVLIKNYQGYMPFIVAVLVLTLTSIVPVIAWGFPADIYDFQEYKQLNKWLQAAGTLGAIFVGTIIGVFSKTIDNSILLLLMALIEFASVLCIFMLKGYLPPMVKPKRKREQNVDVLLKKASLYKYLSYVIIFSFFITILVDYCLKISLAHNIQKEKITDVVSIIFVISSTGTLLVQILFYDLLLQKFGGKKIIFLFPMGLLFISIASFFFPRFVFVAAVFIVNEILYFSVFSLAKNLYLNTLPSLLNNLARVKLNGIIKPVSFLFASFLCLMLSIAGGIRPSIALIIVSCLSMIYLGKILIAEYTKQLMKSIQMHRFNPELIRLQHENPEEVEAMFEQALTSDSIDTILFTLNMLKNDPSLPWPSSINLLIQSKNVTIQIQTIKLLLMHGKGLKFFEKTLSIFEASHDDELRWYLALYLIQKEKIILSFSDDFSTQKSTILRATSCLIYLKQGDFEQQLLAMKQLIAMINSNQVEQQIWFLKILHEIPNIHKDKYLMHFINEGDPRIQTLALEQIAHRATPGLLETLINLIGASSIGISLNKALIHIGEPIIERLEKKFNDTPSYQIKTSCFFIISQIQGLKADLSLIQMFQKSETNVTLITSFAKLIAYRSVKQKISPKLRAFLNGQVHSEVNFYVQLFQMAEGKDPIVMTEIHSRMYFTKKRVLYYLVALSNFIDLFSCLSPLLSNKPNKKKQAIALELLDSKIENRKFSPLIHVLFREEQPELPTLPQSEMHDPWLMNFIASEERKDMTSFYKLIKLRQTNLFKNVSAEALQAVAECCLFKDMAKNEIIFKEEEEGDGLYIIDVGEVIIQKQGKELARLKEGDYFGELALLADLPRFASAIANSEGSLLYIDKLDFDHITDEMPEIMKEITTHIIDYLVSNRTQ